MGIYQEYERHSRDFTYLGEMIKGILSIFRGRGNTQIVTSDFISKYDKKIQDVIIPSNEMVQGLNYIHEGIVKIMNDDQEHSGSLFYFSQYGGSKTQFLNLVRDEIQRSIPDTVLILFDDINDLNPVQLFEKIKESVYYVIPKLSRFSDDRQKYSQLIQTLESISSDIHIDLRHSSNLNKASEILGYIRNRLDKNPDLKKKVREVKDILHSTILVDAESVMKKILNFMRELTRYKFVFLFLYDEVDLWIDDANNTLLFSEKFNHLSKVMKLIFQSSQEGIKIFHVFACTERVNILMENYRFKFNTTSPVASRFVQIYDRSEKILEPGCYANKIEQALAKISAFYKIANEIPKLDEKFLNETLIQLKNGYASYSRRNANSKILNILDSYNLLQVPLKKGLKDWESNTKRYGNLIQQHLPSILKKLNITFERADVLIDPEKTLSNDKIDGFFINYDLNEKEIRTYVEIKVTKQFKKEKAYQILQWSQIRKTPIVYLIFSPSSIETIKQEVNLFAEQKGFTQEDTNRIKYLHISNPYAFCAIAGVENVLTDHQKLVEFYKTYAAWLDFFGNFTKKYQDLREELGLGLQHILINRPAKKESGDIQERSETTTESGEETKPRSETSEGARERTTQQLSPEATSCINLLVFLFKKNKLKGSGLIRKTTIEKIVTDVSLGIGDLEKIYDVMHKFGVVSKKTDKSIRFSSDVLSLDSLDKFIDICKNKFQKSQANVGIFSF
ncbi:MAG: hypothetical protein ACTSUE_22230 [Promethearchaeota archaeon]